MLSITELTTNIKQIITSGMNEKLFIIGEVTNAKKSHQHLFFKLKDENSMIDAVYWNITPDINVENGQKVQVDGYVSYY